ncbi:MAG: ATP synthase F1 subunit gamma [Candidatus Staskawiczbacteria bacterium RIFCSPHIGHO2_02_FULL_43_16]|uniref:ATP synthase gamma chain n=1 Tax=Candidatus Staskawiczbacteria bacterium RIFCSPHIGHO2_01_FULL_41_41 TaxID=1802203 RepID=A0A1G2HY01_9BACT|nr:MAG: ATP synthase F1 subunit gamma [Candidatus Staskawiczbacteria bacterium RIFCSPHIGHO2_01_FULL_41_41]OGZ68511.1 MAG: ATP synthase F1 subunit gamma [Candidatus Staskawiczbacteria bacterium RIFCSPHIGHO2_02_FULL_43_16]OGZ74315.1 MAG: ATP synthase F1 subunit gamma [Candidatus Staskawiczbacteria bacterium RIFCSPLOWO2_01_FULL_43_17b]
MDSPQHLKKRLKSVANINKITKAMELVAATKMRRSQEIALASRPYAFAALDLLANLTRLEMSGRRASTELPILLQQRKIKKVLFVLVASDKGLAGAFNSSLFRKFEKYLQEHDAKYQEEKIFLAIGEKAFQYLSKKVSPVVRTTGLKKFTQVGDFTTVEQVQPIADFLVNGYLEKQWDRVVVFSTNFKSALKQEPMVRRVLPISFDYIKETIQEIVPATGRFSDIISKIQDTRNNNQTYTIEPSPEKVLEKLARHLLFMQVYHVILEANASEHSARRLAMKTASDNASDLGQKLNLQYNKVRQAGITNQIIEISAGAEAQA